MRHPTPQATPVAPAPPLVPFVASNAAPKLKAAVLVLTPEGEFEAQHGVIVVGRDADCHVPVRDDLASRQHACIRISDDEVTIQDLGSTNGVYVNGARLGLRARPLHDGDRLLIGTTEISVFALRARAPRSGNSPI